MTGVEVQATAKRQAAKLRIETNAEPIPGYRLLARLGRGGFGEVWRVEAPGGILKAAKFVTGVTDSGSLAAPALQEFQALRRVKDIRHPYIVSIDRIEVVEETLIIIMEMADQSLHDRLVQRQREGQPGIARDELLVYLCEAGEALDLMNQQHSLQHLDIKPSNLFLVSNHVKVADFGLVRDLGGLGGGVGSSEQGEGLAQKKPLGGITPLYAPPECFQGSVSSTCDQYSLAITYQQLLTGTLPFDGGNARRLALQHTMAEPNLRALPSSDRPIVAKALAKRPESRFGSCMEFLQALVTGQIESAGAPRPHARGRLTSSRVIRRLKGAADTKPEQASGSPGPDKPQHDTDAEICLPAHVSSPAISAARSQIALDDADLAVSPIAAVDGVLPGFQFVSCLSSEPPLREVWKAVGPGKRACQVQIITGFDLAEEATVKQSVLRLHGLQHPGLVPLRIVGQQPGQLFLVAEPAELTVRDCFQQYQKEGQVGIPRDELLDYLHDTAEILDELREICDLYHLGLHPRLLHVANGIVQIAEFGICHLLWHPAGQPLGRLTARYAAPELLGKEISSACDQYSLAVIYQEMLTGVHPFRGQSMRNAASARANSRIDLDMLQAGDRPIITRALENDPRKRFGSCLELIEALQEAGKSAFPADPYRSMSRSSIAMPPMWNQPTAAGNINAVTPTSTGGLIMPTSPDTVRQLIQTLTEPFELDQVRGLRFLHRPGESLKHRCNAYLPASMAAHKLECFRQQWNADVQTTNGHSFVFHMELPRSFWQRLSGRRPGLRVPVQLIPPKHGGQAMTEIEIEVRPVDCEPRQAADLLRQYGPRLVESIRDCVHAENELRGQERLDFERPMQVFPVLPGQRLGPPYACQGKDLSYGGVGFYLPVRPPSEYVCVNVSPNPQSPPLSLLARIVRVQPCANGWWEIGALFLPGGPAMSARRRFDPVATIPMVHASQRPTCILQPGAQTMPDPEREASLEVRRRTLFIIVLALLLGPLIFLAIALAIRQGWLGDRPKAPADPPFVSFILSAVAIGPLLGGLVLPARLMADQRRQIAAGTWKPFGGQVAADAFEPFLSKAGDAGRLMMAYQMRTITGAAFIEASAFMLGVAYLLEGAVFTLVAALTVLLFMVNLLPFKARFEHWLESQLQWIEEERRAHSTS